MQLRTIQIRVGDKLNIGTYESVDVSVEVAADISTEEPYLSSYESLRKVANELLYRESRSKLREVYERRHVSGGELDKIIALGNFYGAKLEALK